MNTEEYIWESLNPKPWQVKEEFILFLKFIRENGIKTILEIGTHKGGSASAFLKMGCEVVSVDIVHHKEVVDLVNTNSKFTWWYRDVFDEELNEDYMHFDLLWIDGDHSYEWCKKDYESYKDLVKPGGFIAFHDVVKSKLHEQQQCEVWKVLEEINVVERTHFIIDGNWGGITIIKV